MEAYRNTLTIFAAGLVLGLIFFVIVWAAHTFNAGLAVGGTFWATGGFLGFSALPERR